MGKKKILCIISLLMLVVALVAGCGSSSNSGSSNGSKEPMKLTMGITPWPTNMFVYVAQEKGFFKQNGIDVTIKEFGATTEDSNAFMAGNLDMITSPSPDVIAPASKGGDFKVIMMTDKSLGSDGLVVKPDIKTIQDLKGKTVAVQQYSVDHMYLLMLLDKAGMKPTDVKIVDMNTSDAGNAFIAGKVDAACIWEPFLSKAVAGGGKLLYTTKEDPDLITDSILASGKMVKNNPQTLIAFLKSWNQAVEYWKSNRADAEAIMAKHMNVSPKEMHDMMDQLQITTAADSVKSFTKADTPAYWGYTQNKIAKFLKDMNVIQKDVNADDLIDAQFVKAVADGK